MYSLSRLGGSITRSARHKRLVLLDCHPQSLSFCGLNSDSSAWRFHSFTSCGSQLSDLAGEGFGARVRGSRGKGGLIRWNKTRDSLFCGVNEVESRSIDDL